jgi:hypothetical protein
MMSILVIVTSMPMACRGDGSQCNGDNADELHDEFDDWLNDMRCDLLYLLDSPSTRDNSNQCCKERNVYRFKQ